MSGTRTGIYFPDERLLDQLKVEAALHGTSVSSFVARLLAQHSLAGCHIDPLSAQSATPPQEALNEHITAAD